MGVQVSAWASEMARTGGPISSTTVNPFATATEAVFDRAEVFADRLSADGS
jgi:hypothetical protein